MEKQNKIIGEGLTFDDVLIVPQYSEILPNLVQTKTNFSKNIELNIPLVSAAMDTVTESKMQLMQTKKEVLVFFIKICVSNLNT